MREVSTVAAYRDRWHITGHSPVGKRGDASSIEQTGQCQRALAERDQAMEERARALANQAVGIGESWVQRLGTPPATPSRRERWIREVSTIAAYRDRWHITGHSPVGTLGDTGSIEQTGQCQRALTAAARATAISSAALEQQSSFSPELAVEAQRGVEL